MYEDIYLRRDYQPHRAKKEPNRRVEEVILFIVLIVAGSIFIHVFVEPQETHAAGPRETLKYAMTNQEVCEAMKLQKVGITGAEPQDVINLCNSYENR